MSRKSKKPHSDLLLGPLPVALINNTLSMELEEGETVLTANHQVHTAREHPGEYPRFLPHIAQIIAFPLYIGDDFKNSGKIELIGRIPVLVTHVLICGQHAARQKGALQSFELLFDQAAAGRIA